MKTTTKRKKEPSVTIVFRMAGQDQTIKTDNILDSFRLLQINPKLLKTKIEAFFTYNGKTFRKLFAIPVFKRFLAKDLNKQIIAKNVTAALGIPK